MDFEHDHSQQLGSLQAKNSQLSQQIIALKEEALAKDRKIIHLSQKISELVTDNERINKQSQHKDVVIKSQSSALNRKNVELQNGDQKQRQKSEQQVSALQKEIAQLKCILREQEGELQRYLKEGEMMVGTFELVNRQQRVIKEERNILKEFNEELLRQIQELESGNQNLISERENFREEVEMQNRQGQDLLAQVESMMDLIDHKA